MALHIVLFEPEIPQNSGNIARTCSALGAQLHFVYPLGFSLTDRYLKRAGLDYWSSLEVHHHPSVASFMEIYKDEALWFFTTKGETVYTDVVYERETFLIFGKESGGIDESILVEHHARCLRVPMRESARSLNLSNTVAIAAYEYERQQRWVELQTKGELHHLSWKEALG